MDANNETLRKNLKAICKNIAKNLKEFGYAGVEQSAVEAQVTLLLEGKEPDDIIGMFAKDMLIENDLLAE